MRAISRRRFHGLYEMGVRGRLKNMYGNAGMTFGCTAKNTPIRNGLEKKSAVDARRNRRQSNIHAA
jgi:hypothetical protein